MLIAIALFMIVLEICLFAQKRFEEVLPALAGALVILCYGLAIFQALAWFQWILCALAAVGLAGCITLGVRDRPGKSLRVLAENVITPGMLCFVAITVFFAIVTAPRHVNHNDELYVWSIQPLSIFAHNGFVDAYHNLSPHFMNYMPGIHLFQWMGLAIHGEWSEGVVYNGLWLFYAILLLPLTRHIRWRTVWKMPLYLVVIILLPAAFDPDSYQNLRVDVALGLCLGYATVQAWLYATRENERLFYGVTLSLALMLLVLLKQPGVAWCVFPLSVMMLANNRQSKARRRVMPLILFAIPPALTFLSWIVVCRVLGLQGQHMNQLSSNVIQMLDGTLPSFQDLTALLAVQMRVVCSGSWTFPTNPVCLPQIVWLLIFTVFPMILYRLGKINRTITRRLVKLLLIGYALYFIAFFIALLTVFRPEWSSPVNNTAVIQLVENIQRYGCGLWYALLIFYTDIGVSCREATPVAIVPKRERIFGRVMGFLLSLAVLLSTPWGGLYKNLTPGQYQDAEMMAKLDNIALNSFWSDSLTDPNAIVLLASDSYPFSRAWLQYALAPRKLIMPYATDDDPEHFVELVRQNHIGYFVSEGEENDLYQTAQAFAEDGYLDSYTVYAVQWNGDTLTLTSELP